MITYLQSLLNLFDQGINNRGGTERVDIPWLICIPYIYEAAPNQVRIVPP